MSKKPFILIDGSSYFYRAFHALPPLSNSKGQPTGAVYGVFNMIRRLLKDYDPEHIAVIFDSKGKTFRDEIYPEYKATREAMPDELSQQFPPLVQIIKSYGLPLIMIEGIEADDIIGTLAHRAEAQGYQVIISTGDKDMAQLVNENITLINTMSNSKLDIQGVIEKFGVAPDKIVDYLALIGDKVDNIPGVPSVGPKTAVKWLQQYGSLEEIVNHADEITGKVGEKLRQSLSLLPLAKQLVTIHRDISPSTLNLNIADLNKQPPHKVELIEICQQLEFRNLLQEFLEPTEEVIAQPTPQIIYQTILTATEFETWLATLLKLKQFVINIETSDPASLHAKIIGLAIATSPDQAVYIPLAHDYENAPLQLDSQWVLTKLKPILENSTIEKIGHNLKYSINIFYNEGIELQGVRYDIMLESYVLNSTASRHDVSSLSLKYLGKKPTSFEDIAGKGSKQLSFNQVSIDNATKYAAENADIIFQLHQVLWPKIIAEPKLQHVFSTIEIPLISVLAKMECYGVLIDPKPLRKQSKTVTKRIAELEEQAYQLAGEMFNLGSPKQLQEIFYQKLKLPILAKTPTGQPSTAESVLSELAYDFPLPKIILEHRGLSKLKSTYLDALPLRIHEKTGRVHTSYNQAVTATGRLSSTDPNLQNIPARTEEGRMIRRAFIAPPGYLILAADYSQIELRIMAHLSQDENLCRAFSLNLDIHQATAAEIFRVPLEEVTHEQRRRAKAINFGLIYGMSAFGVARQLDIPREAAQLYIDLYFERYPGVKKYMDNTRKQAHQTGYVETIYGRRLYLPEINARNLQRQRAAERTAINAPMQGTAADIIKKAMIRINSWLNDSNSPAHMIMQVHDELVFEVKEEYVQKISAQIYQLMTETPEIKVPITVSIGTGPNWEEAH